MIRDKRRLQWVSALATSFLILCLGALSGYLAVDRLTETMEKQIAEDSRVISENLRIIISQVTRELTDQQEAIDQVQKVLASAQPQPHWAHPCHQLSWTSQTAGPNLQEYTSLPLISLQYSGFQT